MLLGHLEHGCPRCFLSYEKLHPCQIYVGSRSLLEVPINVPHLFMCSCCCSCRHFAVNYSCYVCRKHTAAAAGAAGAVVNSARCCCSSCHRCHSVATWQHNCPTNHAGIPITTDNTQRSAADSGHCTNRVRSPIKSGLTLIILLQSKVGLVLPVVRVP